MAVTPRANEPEPLFGSTEAISLGLILIVSFGLACALRLLKASSGIPLDAAYSTQMDLTQFSWVPVLTWVLEFAVYFLLAWYISKYNLVVGIGGAVLSLIVRLALNAFMALVLGPLSQSNYGTLFSQINAGDWPLRLLGVVALLALLYLPCRHWCEAGFGFLPVEERERPVEKPAANATANAAAKPAAKPAHKPAPPPVSTKQFSFDNTRKTTATPIKYTARPIVSPTEALSTKITPPADFSPLPPQDGVTGVVEIPQKVIMDSVPEAQSFLRGDAPVRVRLAVVVTQLRRGTVWLTWQQIFPGGPDDPNQRISSERQDPSLQGRWIRIAAKYYALQVPREFFTKHKQVQLVWLQRPAVPQETLFEEVVKK